MNRYRLTGKKGEAGFTLIEMLIVAGMLSFVMAAVYSLYLTHQRSAYTQDEVVEVQQNLRIAMDRISRDIRMAGFMIPPDPSGTPNPPNATITTTSPTVPVGNCGDNTGKPALAGSSPDPAETVTDEIILNMASESHAYAYIDADQKGIAAPFLLDSSASVDQFADNDYVRIIRPQNRSEVPDGALGGALYQVEAGGRDRTARTLKLVHKSGEDPTNTNFIRGDIIVRTTENADHPNTVRYFVVANGDVATCPSGPDQLCLARRTNEGTPNVDTQIIAVNIANFQLKYILDGNPKVEVTNVPDLEHVRAIKVTITGRTTATLALSGTGTWTKDRSVTSTILLRNRLMID